MLRDRGGLSYQFHSPGFSMYGVRMLQMMATMLYLSIKSVSRFMLF